MPKVIAQMAGANIEAAIALRVCVNATQVKDVTNGSSRQLPVTSSAAIAINARLRRLLSTQAPAGVWVINAATPAMVMTRPMLAGSQ